MRKPTEQDIAARAYRLWEEAGMGPLDADLGLVIFSQRVCAKRASNDWAECLTILSPR